MNERPAFLDHDPVRLKFGTSGLRGLVREMTDLEVYINTQGFLRYLRDSNAISAAAPVALGRDLRDHDPSSGLSSSPRIAAAATQAIRDLGHPVIDAGILPTPALAAFALAGHGPSPIPAIMVTGSHIPADRNGMKFYQTTGEVLKSDEAGILDAVAAVRSEIYGQSAKDSPFDRRGMLRAAPSAEAIDPRASQQYVARYVEPFGDAEPLAGLRVVVYQHSSAARDILLEVLTALGADVLPVGRVDHFVAVDTEDVTVADESKYRRMVLRHGADALVSTDGDGDRPLVIDGRGRFHRGDALGIVCTELVAARFAAVPVSSTDAIERHLSLPVIRTRIGSPYVIAAMNRAVAEGAQGVVGWAANGGFMTATPFVLNGTTLRPLPTRDAVLPILAALLASAKERTSLAELFGRLPRRATRAGLLDDFAPDRGRALLDHLRPPDASIRAVRFGPSIEVRIDDGDWRSLDGSPAPFTRAAQTIERYFGAALGLGAIRAVDLVDGVRMFFDNDDVIHLRPSGNAPQFRVYVVTDTQARADALVTAVAAEPSGVLRHMERELIG